MIKLYFLLEKVKLHFFFTKLTTVGGGTTAIVLHAVPAALHVKKHLQFLKDLTTRTISADEETFYIQGL